MTAVFDIFCSRAVEDKVLRSIFLSAAIVAKCDVIAYGIRIEQRSYAAATGVAGSHG